MSKKALSIPVNSIAGNPDTAVSIERMHFSSSEEATLNSSEEAKQSHREDRNTFFFLEGGEVHIEIDFQKYEIKAPSVIYMHPDQVHRLLKFKNVTVSSLAISNESLNLEYLKLLETLTPAKPLKLDEETFSVISEAVSLCIKCSKRKYNKLHDSLLKDCCNTVVGLVISQCLIIGNQTNPVTRFKVIADAFKTLLESNFINIKSPAGYAQQLNISTPYLNECVKNVTGNPVSFHIRQRVILEAKRLLYHSVKSIKEISSELGYDDYPYFSRVFTKAVGVTPLAFRNKNRE